MDFSSFEYTPGRGVATNVPFAPDHNAQAVDWGRTPITQGLWSGEERTLALLLPRFVSL